jgi:UDP-GlcNAc:undecaprenyl-phosphate GlcNAc-1-phosphate transferase
MTFEFLAAILGFIVASLLIPVVIAWAHQQSILDFPDEGRRRHAVPTPRAGGIALFVAIVVASAVCLLIAHQTGRGTEQVPPWAALLLGATLVFIVGLIDDIRGVPPLVKLIAHSTAAFNLVASGFQVHSVVFAAGGTVFDLGWFGVPVTVLWIVGVTNAFNLIDGVDGLATTFAIIGLTAVVVAMTLLQPTHSLVVTAASLGAFLAFLRFNKSPAKVFLGDCGSTTIGYFLSVQLVVATTGKLSETYALVPLFALAYPLTDTAVAITRRWLRGDPLSRADGRHIHHQLLSLGMPARRAVDLLALIFSAVAVIGVSIAFAPPRVMLALATGGSILAFTSLVYSVRLLGYHEFSELATSMVSVVLNARSHVRRKIQASDIAARVDRADNIDQLRTILDDGAAELGFLEVTLDTHSVPFIGPSHRRLAPRSERPIRVECSIIWDGGEAVLRFWCDHPGAYTHLGAERLASRIAPAVQTWFQRNSGKVVMHGLPDRRSGGFPAVNVEH